MSRFNNILVSMNWDWMFTHGGKHTVFPVKRVMWPFVAKKPISNYKFHIFILLNINIVDLLEINGCMLPDGCSIKWCPAYRNEPLHPIDGPFMSFHTISKTMQFTSSDMTPWVGITGFPHLNDFFPSFWTGLGLACLRAICPRRKWGWPIWCWGGSMTTWNNDMGRIQPSSK